MILQVFVVLKLRPTIITNLEESKKWGPGLSRGWKYSFWIRKDYNNDDLWPSCPVRNDVEAMFTFWGQGAHLRNMKTLKTVDVYRKYVSFKRWYLSSSLAKFTVKQLRQFVLLKSILGSCMNRLKKFHCIPMHTRGVKPWIQTHQRICHICICLAELSPWAHAPCIWHEPAHS